ncbi:MAG: hypothetical protein HOU81_16810 [Hamadaea sp.]|uniref:ArnT family glycosyltransferase n=1 Tax=Hamadaea sp. TaxID=2024425 RepID=UPI0018531B95|nr:glycosyltransferase family 39 protein [Hamadaea sp.]NUR72478.1 hypothetical protein [Hamadaea sp.]NUT19158.1 hypothetical protein [Hamadaea sp.]
MTAETVHSARRNRPLLLTALVAALVEFAFSGRYGFHRDELYYLAAGRHPAFGYDDQPPLAPLWAGFTGWAADGWPDWLQLMLLRLPSSLAVGAIVLVTGIIAAEFGGSRRAQTLAGLAMAIAPAVVVSGHLLSTTPFDILVWSTLAWLLARWVRTRDDRLLLLLGVVAGVGLQVKNLPLVYAAGLVAGLLLAGPREVFRRWQLWAGGLIALLIWAPNLWWQATHGWPQVAMTAVIRDDADWGGRAGLIPFQILLFGIVTTIVWATGLWRLLRDPTASPFRALGWAYLVVLVLVLATGGREYYPAGAYPALLASGGIVLDRWLGDSSKRRATVGWVAGLSAVSTLALSLPVYPVAMLHATPEPAVNYDAGETVGWPGFAEQVAVVYRGLSAEEQRTAVLLAGNYGEAGALDHYGPSLGLPQVYSAHLAYWRWGPPPEGPGPVILVGHGWKEAELRQECADVTHAATFDNGVRLDNDEQGAEVWVCRGKRRTWAELWPGLRRL